MNKQSGFAIVEGLIIVVVIAAIAGGGYLVWHRQHPTKVTATTAATGPKLTYTSPAVTTATAPAITKGSDLSTALETLNQTDVNAGTTDSTQLSSQAAGL